MRILFILSTVLFSQLLSAAPKAELWDFWQSSNEASTTQLDHSPWQSVLDAHLQAHPSGINRFDYGGISSQSRTLLRGYLDQLQAVKPRSLNRSEQQAYWINLYNALTVQVILDEYPVKSILKTGKGFFSFGPWGDKLITIEGKKLSLNDIEHRILRPIWRDARIHFVVNCASLGCPNLQAQAFTADNTDALMAKASLEFLSHSRAISLDKKGRLKLSKIFDWYQSDFGSDEKQMLTTLAGMAPKQQASIVRSYLDNRGGNIIYHYDWDLNQP